MLKYIFIVFVFIPYMLISQEIAFESPIPDFKFGMKANTIKKSSKDVSNPNSLDETCYKPLKTYYFRNQKLDSIYLTFYNNRLYEIKMYLPNQNWDDNALYFSKTFGPIWNTSDSISAEKQCLWGSSKNTVGMSQLGSILIISYDDDNQKEFQFLDLFTSSFVYVILTLVTLFILLWLFAKLYTSYCPSCKSFSMKYISGGRGDGRYYNPEFLRTDNQLYYDSNYTYKCKKCKHIRHDHYSGFWVWFRSKHE